MCCLGHAAPPMTSLSLCHDRYHKWTAARRSDWLLSRFMVITDELSGLNASLNMCLLSRTFRQLVDYWLGALDYRDIGSTIFMFGHAQRSLTPLLRWVEHRRQLLTGNHFDIALFTASCIVVLVSTVTSLTT